MKNKLDVSWFDLKKYDDQKDFNSRSWMYALLKRRILRRSIDKKVNSAGKDIAEIKENPLSNKAEPLSNKAEPNDLSSSVRNALYGDLLCASFWNPEINDIFTSQEMESQEILGKPVTFDDNFLGSVNQIVSINLRASDEQLELDFKKWLDEKREVNNCKVQSKIFTSKDYKKWVKNMVLPYLDLTMVASFEGKELPQHLIADLLYPDVFDVATTEKVRKAVKPLAESLLKREVISAFTAQCGISVVFGGGTSDQDVIGIVRSKYL
jgi:hypothetical protein